MKKAIIYGRVSTNKQSSESIKTQIAECKKWAENNNCEIVDIYDDSGQSGRSYNVGNRRGFQQIKEDAKNGRMDYALIHKIDRFARSVLDYLTQEKELMKYGIEIIVVSMPHLSQADIVVKSLHIAMAEQFSTNLSHDVSTKMLTFAKKGAYLGSQAPYGYDLKEIDGSKQLVPNPEQANGVKFIFKTYLSGYGYISTAKVAAKAGYVNGKGNPFTPNAVKQMLQNKRYNGWYIFGMRTQKDGKQTWQTDPEKIIEIPNAHEKIIDDDMFQAVQDKIKNSYIKNNRKKRDYPLTGKMICGICGRPYTGYANNKKKDNPNKIDYNLYRCTGKRLLNCESKGVRACKIEDYVFVKIKEYIFDDNFVNSLIHEVDKHLSGDVSSFRKIYNQLEKEIKSINSEIKSATRDKYKHKISEDLYDELVDDLAREKETLETRLRNVKKQLAVEDKKKDIRKYVDKIKNDITSADAEIKNAILRQVVREIIVYDDKIDIYLNMSNNPPPPKKGGKFLRLHNIQNGVPLCTLDSKIDIYSGNGLDYLNFDMRRSDL